MYKAHAHRKHELHPVDQFMLELCEIPCLSIRIDICLVLWEFPWQYDSTCQVTVEPQKSSLHVNRNTSAIFSKNIFFESTEMAEMLRLHYMYTRTYLYSTAMVCQVPILAHFWRHCSSGQY